jgi:hypothetical protein
MTHALHRVAVVVDSAYGGRVGPLADRCHTWVARSRANDAAVAAYRGEHPRFSPDSGITDFGSGATPEESLVDILPVVEEHHGSYGHDPPLSVIEVVGVPPTPTVRHELAALGFDEIDETAEGFVARR